MPGCQSRFPVVSPVICSVALSRYLLTHRGVTSSSSSQRVSLPNASGSRHTADPWPPAMTQPSLYVTMEPDWKHRAGQACGNSRRRQRLHSPLGRQGGQQSAPSAYTLREVRRAVAKVGGLPIYLLLTSTTYYYSSSARILPITLQFNAFELTLVRSSSY